MPSLKANDLDKALVRKIISKLESKRPKINMIFISHDDLKTELQLTVLREARKNLISDLLYKAGIYTVVDSKLSVIYCMKKEFLSDNSIAYNYTKPKKQQRKKEEKEETKVVQTEVTPDHNFTDWEKSQISYILKIFDNLDYARLSDIKNQTNMSWGTVCKYVNVLVDKNILEKVPAQNSKRFLYKKVVA